MSRLLKLSSEQNFQELKDVLLELETVLHSDLNDSNINDVSQLETEIENILNLISSSNVEASADRPKLRSNPRINELAKELKKLTLQLKDGSSHFDAPIEDQKEYSRIRALISDKIKELGKEMIS